MIAPLDIKFLLGLESDLVFAYCYQQLHTIYGKDTIKSDWNNYMVFEGANPNSLVAHIDTCTRKTVDIKQKNNIIYNPNAILGADDRAGVYGLIKAAQKCHKKGIALPTLIFTNYEESGGKGVGALVRAKILDVEKTRLFIELDRKGCNEYVYYSWKLPKQVKKYVESFGFVKSEGSYSDIADLTSAYEIPAVNLSIGYYDQHTCNERLHVDEMEFTINRLVRMLQNPISQLHICKDTYDERSYLLDFDPYGLGKSSYSRSGYGSYGSVSPIRPTHTYGGHKNVMEQYYDYDRMEMMDYPDHKTLHTPDAYYASTSGVMFGRKRMTEMKDEIKRELLMDGAIYSVYEDIDDNDFDALMDVEKTFALYVSHFPDCPEEAFEEAWEEVVKRFTPVIDEEEFGGVSYENYKY